MNSDFFQKVADAAVGNAPAWLATVVTTAGSTPACIGMKMIVYADGSIAGTIGGGELEKAVIDKVLAELPVAPTKWELDLGSATGAQLATSMTCGGVQEILVEPLRNGIPLVIFGGGHCGAALSFLATWSGFTVTVVDDRKEWASRSKHPAAARILCMDYGDIPGSLDLGPDTYAVIMTHGHEHDGLVLRRIMERRLAYLGMLGSKAKVRELFDALRAEGIGDEHIARVVAPIGVPIGSHRPEEIAVSIVAQMIAVHNGVHNGAAAPIAPLFSPARAVSRGPVDADADLPVFPAAGRGATARRLRGSLGAAPGRRRSPRVAARRQTR